MNGYLYINKEKDYTSRDVVNLVCKKLKTKKVGHAGTLDPLALGVLIIGIGKGTKLLEDITGYDKEYVAEVKLGFLTDTLDIEGKILKENYDYKLDVKNLEKVINSFLGTYIQEVPIYSAVKVKGKKLYEYARNDKEVILPKKEVTIKEIELLETNEQSFKFRALVSKGTYIRSLIRDIGDKLDIYCTMSALTRTKQGNVKIEECFKIDDVTEQDIIKINDVIEFDKYIYEKEDYIKNGRKIENIDFSDKVAIYSKENQLLAIYRVDPNDDKLLKPYKMLLEDK